MSLREQFTDQLKASMKAGTAPRTSTLRMILARLKDVDIAARPKGVDREAQAWNLKVNRDRVTINWKFTRKKARQKFGYKRNKFRLSET